MTPIARIRPVLVLKPPPVAPLEVPRGASGGDTLAAFACGFMTAIAFLYAWVALG